jgi:hypothetical protein
VSQFAGIDLVEISAHFVEATFGDAQHGQRIVAEEQYPSVDIRQRVVEHLFVVLQ